MKQLISSFVSRTQTTSLTQLLETHKHSHFCSQGLFLGLKKLQPLFFVNTNMTDVPPRYAHCVNMCVCV